MNRLYTKREIETSHIISARGLAPGFWAGTNGQVFLFGDSWTGGCTASFLLHGCIVLTKSGSNYVVLAKI